MAEENAKKWAKVIARAWTDEAYKRRLVGDPAAVLKEAGIRTPSGAHIHVHENTGNALHLVLPAKPAGALTAEEMERQAGTLGRSALTCS